VSTNYNLILDKLQVIADKEGGLPDFLTLYRESLSIQLRAKDQASTGACPSSETAMGRHSQGIPILKFDEIGIDWGSFANVLREAADILARHQVLGLNDAEPLRNLADDAPFLKEASESLFEGQPMHREGIDSNLLQMALQMALWPFLSRCAETLSPLIKQEHWLRGTCPICGGNPDFAYLEKEAGARWMMCSRCDTTWLFRRLHCPYCDTEDQDKLGYLQTEDGTYRLYLCDQCRNYLKVVDLRKVEADVLLPLERLLTLDMDRQAHEEGYGSDHPEGS
jgi:formate dehydrogenase maturation protein FdhE